MEKEFVVVRNTFVIVFQQIAKINFVSAMKECRPPPQTSSSAVLHFLPEFSQLF